jgi:hypothetical protein
MEDENAGDAQDAMFAESRAAADFSREDRLAGRRFATIRGSDAGFTSSARITGFAHLFGVAGLRRLGVAGA